MWRGLANFTEEAVGVEAEVQNSFLQKSWKSEKKFFGEGRTLWFVLKSITTAVETIEKRSFEELNLCIAEFVKRVSGFWNQEVRKSSGA